VEVFVVAVSGEWVFDRISACVDFGDFSSAGFVGPHRVFILSVEVIILVIHFRV